MSARRSIRGESLGAGRLAQLVEHLVYTERVGGSSPSPPTRFFAPVRQRGDATVKLVLFDCDGTLVDSQHVILEAMARAFAGAGLAVPPRETVLGIVGLSLTEAMRRIGGEDPAFPAEELAELYRGAFRTLRTEPGFREPLYPGIAEVIETLARRDDVADRHGHRQVAARRAGGAGASRPDLAFRHRADRR